ncbi:hypothetical protein C1645_748695 [Glomus cerebriforme]|uniref:HMG box domain-containing protein n=1 Tax=Glomus cerebriforme TaxID=658196 RepID=A0A397TQN7_9GLOM|nr:hypothetical protein C1645_748695 [Glomus cerebriforme]
MPKKSRGCKTSNAFLIYRTIYCKTLSQKGISSKMTEVSRWASESWNNEREELKSEYREFAKKVSKIYQSSTETFIPRVLPTIKPTQPTESYHNIMSNNKTPNITSQCQNMNFIQQQQPLDCQGQFQILPNLSTFNLVPLIPQFRPCEICCNIRTEILSNSAFHYNSWQNNIYDEINIFHHSYNCPYSY